MVCCKWSGWPPCWLFDDNQRYPIRYLLPSICKVEDHQRTKHKTVISSSAIDRYGHSVAMRHSWKYLWLCCAYLCDFTTNIQPWLSFCVQCIVPEFAFMLLGSVKEVKLSGDFWVGGLMT